LFTASTIVSQGARFAFSLVAARALAPADFTAWALVVAALAYAPSLLLGVANGMTREIPVLNARGMLDAAGRAVAAGWGATTVVVVLIMAAAVLAAATLAPPGARLSAVLVGVLAAGTTVIATQQFILRASLRFDAASVQQLIFGAVVTLAAVPLALGVSATFETAAALYAVALIVAVALGVLVAPPSRVGWDAAELRRLAAIGFPIMLAGLVFSVFITVDRWMAATLLGAEAAAPYALASLTAAGILLVPTVVSQQTYPRMAIAHGSGASTEELRAIAHSQGIFALALVAPVAASVALFAWLGVPLVVPAYAHAAPAVLVLAVGFVALSYLTGYGNYLNVIDRQWRYLSVQLLGAASGVALVFVGGRLLGLTGIALGMTMSHVLYGVVLRAVAERTRPSTRDSLGRTTGTGPT
jgi:O-antigen/teichoic acid export membrane protein